MARLTLRLPETLHTQLADLAGKEGVSLNQYIVYALSQQSAQTYVDRTQPMKTIAEQQLVYETVYRREETGVLVGAQTPPIRVVPQVGEVVDADLFLRQTQKLRDLTFAYPLTDEVLEAVIAEGRP